MNVGAITKARIGFAIAVGMLIGIAEGEACARSQILQHYITGFCLAVAGAGALSWLVGQIAQSGGKGIEHPLAFLKSLRYWGLILMVSTTGFYCRTTLYRPHVIVVRAKPPVVFPSLELQGLVINGAKSSALINGQVLFVGDEIGQVQLVAIDSEHATVTLDGSTNILKLRK
jgi:hypothetical protein